MWDFIGEMMNAYKICKGKPEGKRQLRRRRWEDIIKTDHKDNMKAFLGFRIASDGGRL
jgi:hypothetical protein